MAGALGFFVHSVRSHQRILRKDDMIWLHFEKGHSVCFERRKIEGMQECEAPDQPHSSCNFRESSDASLGHGDGGGGGGNWSDSRYI